MPRDAWYLQKPPIGAILAAVKIKTVSFENLQRDKRRERARDERRLARGEVTPEELEEENALFPMDAKAEVPELFQTLALYYGK